MRSTKELLRNLSRCREPLAIAAIFFFVALSAQTAASALAGTGKWTSIDMGGGAYNMVVKAGPSGIVIDGSDLSGAYISTNLGTSWSCIGSAQGMPMCHVSAIGFDPNNTNVIVLGGNGGLYRSTNAGATFTQTRSDGYFTDIAFAKANSQIAYAGGDPFAYNYAAATSQIFKSTNNGQNWTAMASTPAGIKISKIIVHPSNPSLVYIISGPARFCSTAPQSLYRSLDGGTNWTQFATTVPYPLDFELDPSDPNQVMYVSSFYDVANYYQVPRLSTDGLWKSTNGGATWTKKTTASSNIWGTVHVSLRQTNVVRVIGDYNVWESTDNGNTWNWKGGQGSWNKAGGLSWFYGAFDPNSHGNDLSNPDRYYWINSLWIFSTSDGGASMQALYTRETPKGSNRWKNTGIKNTCVWQVTVDEADPNVIFAAFWDMGLWRSLDHGDTWESCNNLDYSGNWTEPLVSGSKQGIGGNSRCVITDPTRANVVWAAVGGDQNQTLYLLRSTNYGKFDSWQPTAGLPATSDIQGLSVDPTSPSSRRILYCTGNGDVYRSPNDGSNWVSMLAGKNLQYTQVDPTNGSYVYAGGEGGFFCSSARGISTSWIQTGLPEMTSVRCIRCDRSNPGWLYVVCYGNGSSAKGLYRSKDRGATWQKILSDCFLRGVAVDPKNSNNLYAASSSNETWGWYDPRSQGVLYSRDGGMTWKQANEGLSWPFAYSLAVDPQDPSYVFLGSPGLGFQRRQFTDLVALHLSLPEPQKGVIRFWWNSDPGWTYQVIRKAGSSNAWSIASVLPSAGQTTSYSASLDSSACSFYQVLGFAP